MLAPGETTTIQIHDALSNDAEIDWIQDAGFFVFSNQAILIDEVQWYGVTKSPEEGFEFEVLNQDSGFETSVGEFSTSTPEEVTLFRGEDNQISGESSLHFELGDWRMASFNLTYPWAAGPFANEIRARGSLQLTQALQGKSFTICTRVYYLNNQKEEYCQSHTQGVARFNIDRLVPLNPQQQVWRIYFSLRSYASADFAGLFDDFKLTLSRKK